MQVNVWDKLLNFETRDLIEKFIQKKHNRAASARQILEISSNFIQGREYFRNAENADITVKPLLLYYGVSALSRGLILATQPHLSEAALKPSHGLETQNWRETLTIKDFAALSSIVRPGTFYDLLNATSNKSYFKHNSNGINWNVEYSIPTAGTVISFKDLVFTLPDLQEEFEMWTEEKLHFVRLSAFSPSLSGHYLYTIQKHNSLTAIKEIFNPEMFDDFQLKEEADSYKITTAKTTVPQISQRFADGFNMGIGEAVLTKTIKNKTHLNSLSQFYCLSYYLGMLSRYFPSIWISLGRREKGDSVFPLMKKAVNLIETQFPSLIVEYLAAPFQDRQGN